jgi:formate dehydrogenase subunit gamma
MKDRIMSRIKIAIASLGPVLAFVALLYVVPAVLTGSPSLDNAALAQTGGNVPGNTVGNTSDADIWRAIRGGIKGDVSIEDKKAGYLIQSQGDAWRAMRNGPLSVYGSWAIFGVIALLALFFLIRGRIRIDAGASGRMIERFSSLERFSHWLLANSFVLLALTGLNMLYGRYVLKPIIGASAFSTVTEIGKYIHDFVAFAFMLALLMILVLWIRNNIPDRYDLTWLAKGGGMFSKKSHPPARKFNAGQKILFWLVILGGISISLSGISLLFPFKFSMFAPTFAALNLVGLGLPTDLTPMQEMQYSELWHAFVALGLIALVIAHIYIGTLGMEGAFDAMGNGEVDRNWAKEHHPIWLEEEDGAKAPGDD